MQSPASLHLVPITFSLLPTAFLSVLMLSPLLVCSQGTSVTLDNFFPFPAPLLDIWNHPLSLFLLFCPPFHGFPCHHLFPSLSYSLLCPPALHPTAQLPSIIPLYAFFFSWSLSLWSSPSHLPIASVHHLQPSLVPSLVDSRAGVPIQQCSITLPCISSCFDGAGTNVAEDVRSMRSEWLPGGLLLCWSVGTGFPSPPWHRELLSESTGTGQHRLQIYRERFVCNGSNPGGLREAASSKKTHGFQY